MNLNARYFALIFVSLFAVVSQIKAATLDIPVEVNFDDPSNPKLNILTAVNEIDPNCKLVSTPLIVMVDSAGNIVNVVDPDFFTQKFIENNLQAQGNTLIDINEFKQWPRFFSSENGKKLLLDGVLTTVKGLGKLSAGTIIIASIIACKTGKFLAVKTYKATNWMCKRLWDKIVNYYERKKFECDFSLIPEFLIPYPSTTLPYPD